MTKKLRRSHTDRVLGGVCAGIADYLALDPILVRLFFVLLVLGDGIGVLLYLILWVVIPSQSAEQAEFGARVGEAAGEIGQRAGELAAEMQQAARDQQRPAARWIGVALLAAGAYYLLRNMGISWLGWLDADLLWPVLLIVAGLFVLVRRSVADVE